MVTALMDLPKYKAENFCYQCGGLIETYSDHIIKQVPVVTSVKVEEPELNQDGEEVLDKNGEPIMVSKKVTRVTFIANDFHKNCLEKYENNFNVENEKLAQDAEDSETASWNELYYYWKYKIYEYPAGPQKSRGGAHMNLPDHLIMRLRGLRVGKYLPNRENVLYRDVGYPYEVILLTTKFKSADLKYYKKKGSFTDAQHEANYLMKIVTDNIDFIHERYLKNLKAQQIAERRKFDFEEITKYSRKPDESNSEVKEQLDSTNKWLEDRRRKKEAEDFNEL